MHPDYLIYTRRRKFFIWVLVICAFSFNKVHSGNPYGNYNKPSQWEVQQYMNNLRNPVTTTVSKSVSVANGLPGSSSSQDCSSQIAALRAKLESESVKLTQDFLNVEAELYSVLFKLDNAILQYRISGPPATTSVSYGRWSATASFWNSTKDVTGWWDFEYVVTVRYTPTGQTFGNAETAHMSIWQMYQNDILELANKYDAMITALIAESTKSDTWDSLSDSGFEPLQPLSTESKFESRFKFNTPGRFNRWIDDLEPGEFKKLGPPFPEKQMEKFKRMKEAADEMENISREKKQQQQQLERIEQDPNLTEEQKEHAREYCDSVTVDLTDKEDAVYVGLYGDIGEFDRIEQEGEKSLTTVDVPPIGKYEDAPQVDGTTYDTEKEESEPSDLKMLLEGVKGVGTDAAVTTVQVGLALADIPVGDAISLAMVPLQAKKTGKEVADALLGEDSAFQMGVNNCLNGTFDSTGFDDAMRDSVTGALIAFVKARSPLAGFALELIAKKAKQERKRERGY